MRVRFFLSGSQVFEGETDCVPPTGSDVTFRMQAYKKGIELGTLVTATVVEEGGTTEYDFTEEPPCVRLALDSFRMIGSQ